MNLLERLEMMLNENTSDRERFWKRVLERLKDTHHSDSSVKARQNYEKCVSAIAAGIMLDQLSRSPKLTEDYKEFVKGLNRYSNDLMNKIRDYMGNADKGFDFNHERFSDIIKEIIGEVYKEGPPKKDE